MREICKFLDLAKYDKFHELHKILTLIKLRMIIWVMAVTFNAVVNQRLIKQYSNISFKLLNKCKRGTGVFPISGVP